ncbi:MAG: hypothetical protein IPK76_14480 [Lewinellaceae bacterium]|nr:hypothetical protein [Lewinellaceae bacterium]
MDATAVELRFDVATGINDPVTDRSRLQVRPNPFRDSTTVAFSCLAPATRNYG